MSIEAFAHKELTRAGLFGEDSDYGGMLGEAVMKLVRVFADEGHSGMSAGMAISIFEKVARYEPLTPLTGEPDEWNEVVPGEMWQNNRCAHVFKDSLKGPAYDADGRIFREPSGSCFTNRNSRVFVSFPYTPKREYVDVDADGKPLKADTAV